ncbi:MAG TPA: siderophore-interacting protein [Lapillicoccus sp.]|nr:siderophore-interacting protein [Lapillicoccus sp.]
MTVTTVAPWRLFHTVVGSVDDLSPSLRRIRFVGPELEHFADPGLDQRIKLLVGPWPEGLEAQAEDWYAAWVGLPDEVRPAMRTYTTRRVTHTEAGWAVDVDMVLHADAGPAGDWAARAESGDAVVLVGPDNRFEGDPGGRAFAPPAEAGEVLLVGDETALPAVARILEDLAAADSSTLRVTALVEVPVAADCLDLVAPPGAQVVWLVRAGRPHGVALERAVRSWTMVAAGAAQVEAPPVSDEAEELLWEVPEAGDADAADQGVASTPLRGAYVWVAAEQGVVRGIRRHLLGEVGLDRGQVALMGYWRLGRAQA